MTIEDLEKMPELRCTQKGSPDRRITGGYTSDLLSDVMANAPADSVLITIQAHKNSVAVSGLADIAAIILCNGRSAPDDMRKAAAEEGISIFETDLDQFHATLLVGTRIHPSP